MKKIELKKEIMFLTEKQKFIADIEQSLDNTIVTISAGAFGFFSFIINKVDDGKYIVLLFSSAVLFILLSQMSSLKSFVSSEDGFDMYFYDKITSILNFLGRAAFVFGLIMGTLVLFY